MLDGCIQIISPLVFVDCEVGFVGFFFVGFHNFCGFFFLLLNYRCLILNVKNKFKKIKNIYYFNIFLNKITF
jgi:hypothetical protein